MCDNEYFFSTKQNTYDNKNFEIQLQFVTENLCL